MLPVAQVFQFATICLVLAGLLVGQARSETTEAATAWPHTLTRNGATVVVYQPQAIAWPEHKTLTARAAIAITRPGERAPLLGTIELTLTTETDAESGIISLSNPKLESSHFPALDTAQAALIEQKIRQALPDMQIKQVPLSAVLLSLKEKPAASDVPVDNNPPVVFYSEKPASLVVFDGDPVLVQIGNTGISYAVNTNWYVFSNGGAWYLLNNGQWLSSSTAEGPYKPITTLPKAFGSIPADKNFADVRKAIPPRAGNKPAPIIFVSTKPAEIIITAGAPQFALVAGTSLQVVKNTPNTLFFEPSSSRFFVLFSGRWFAASGLNGPWRFATNELPADFAMISADSPQASVLPSVPGTTQAELAVMKANIPQQATVQKNAAKLTVVYAGPPQFKPIPGTSMTYAVNTAFDVIETGGRYYVCYQGVWFTGASPNGPWVLAESVPEVIYTIP
ncbi:MAG: hypothetical protein JO227_06065, partial [Acetobacteraceae bacterium]|nr:hypothetical protein [Acetobacteraceae bacterium]